MGSPDITFPDAQSFASMIFANANLLKQQEFDGIVGCSTALMKTLNLVRGVAPTDSTVLIQSETGTGKELIAHAIHNVSPRCGRALIRMNCAATPLDLLESELFGHERGAFTRAITQKIWRFEMAHQGALLLDEVGDIPQRSFGSWQYVRRRDQDRALLAPQWKTRDDDLEFGALDKLSTTRFDAVACAA